MTSAPRPVGKPRPNGRVTLGLLQMGLGNPAGFAQFGKTPEAFLASLAPLLGFLIVAGLMLAWSGHAVLGLSLFLTMLCNWLAPAVIADLLCRLWKRQERWAQYANVLNCAQWLMVAALMLLLPIEAVFVSAGVSMQVATVAMVLVFFLYVMWFHWFAARHVLDLSASRALVMMLAVVFGTGVLLQLPTTIAVLAGQHVATFSFPAANPPAK